MRVHMYKRCEFNPCLVYDNFAIVVGYVRFSAQSINIKQNKYINRQSQGAVLKFIPVH